MAEPLFSEREGLAPRHETQADGYLPPWVREAVTSEIRDFVENKLSIGFPDLGVYSLFRPYIWKALQREPPTSPLELGYAKYYTRLDI